MIALLISLFACSGETPEDPEAHACEVIDEAGTAITAAAAMDATAPSITPGETPYTVTLVESAPGYVAIEVAEDTPALLFMGTADVAADLYLPDGTAMGLPDPAPVEACTEIPEHYDLDLHETGTWYLELGPAAVAEVWLLLHPGSHTHE